MGGSPIVADIARLFAPLGSGRVHDRAATGVLLYSATFSGPRPILRHRSLLLHTEPRFGASLAALPLTDGPHRKSWLRESGSLTRRLRALCGPAFRVAVLGEDWRPPFPLEAVRLRSDPRRLVWTREVALHCGDRPLIVARSLIPGGLLQGRHAQLSRLGQRPLGEWLFTNPDLRRLALEFARVEPDRWRGLPALAEAHGNTIWGRRALYRIAGQRLLVCEFFLPELFRLEGEVHGFPG